MTRLTLALMAFVISAAAASAQGTGAPAAQPAQLRVIVVDQTGGGIPAALESFKIATEVLAEYDAQQAAASSPATKG